MELRGLRRNEVFLQTKRFLGMVRFYPLTNFLLLLFFIFDITLIPFFFFFFFKGCSKHFQNGGDVPLRLTVAG